MTWVRRNRLEMLWALFALANLAWMLTSHDSLFETVPFHLIWISLTLLYGLRVWEPLPTAVVLALVVATTLAAQLWVQVDHFELTEVPLMAAVFLAMVWHARRRKHAMERLAAAAERERAFLGDASHQLRTPITVARGHAELIQRRAGDPEVVADTEVILDELDNLSRLSDRILMLASAEQPSFILPDAADVQELVDRVAARWRATAPMVAADHGPALGADVDAGRIVEALDALVENAVDHTPADGRIRLAVRGIDGHVVFSVTDTGSGIPAEHRDRVFDRFYGTRTGGRRSTGLGLAIVRSIARAHGGDVRIESPTDGGTRVTMRLPRRTPEA